jgi:hypothetical protein
VTDVDEFIRQWRRINIDDDQIERCRKSASGIQISDFGYDYDDDEELNIVQPLQDFEILWQETVQDTERIFELNDRHTVFIENLECDIIGARMGDGYYRFIRPRVKGICGINQNWLNHGDYCPLGVYGNKVLDYDRETLLKAGKRSDFNYDRLTSIVYFMVDMYDEKYKVDAKDLVIDQGDGSIIFRDIFGKF